MLFRKGMKICMLRLLATSQFIKASIRMSRNPVSLMFNITLKGQFATKQNHVCFLLPVVRFIRLGFFFWCELPGFRDISHGDVGLLSSIMEPGGTRLVVLIVAKITFEKPNSNVSFQ